MRDRGFSLIEIILAVALLAVFSSGAVGIFLQGFRSNRLGAEETIATQYASEGLEAVRSIKNRGYSLLSNTAAVGIAKSGGVWTFSGTNNVFEKYTRVLAISEVQRDGSGNIVQNGGTVDPLTKKITSTVSWNFGAGRDNSVVLNTYMTGWKLKKSGGGMLIYANTTTADDGIAYKIFSSDTDSWSVPVSTADVDGTTTDRMLRAVRIFSSATRSEKIIISRHYNGATQYIYGQVFNGSSWGNVVLLSSWNSTALLDVQNFDGTYLANGDFMVVYSDNSNIPKFRIWNGSSWSGASISMQDIGGIPSVVVAKARPGANEVMAVFFDQSSDTNSQYFNGGTYVAGSWTIHAEHAAQAPTITKRHLDFTWSQSNSVKGGLIYSNVGADTSIGIKLWTANGIGGGAWGSGAKSANSGGRLGPMALSSGINLEEYLACQKDANNDIYCFNASNVPVWISSTNNIITTTSQTGIQRSFHQAYETLGGNTGLIVYSDNTSVPKFRKYNTSSNSFDLNIGLTPALGGVVHTIKILPQSASDDMMVLMGDENLDLYSIMWDGTNDLMYTTPSGKALTAHGTNGSSTADFWYDFVWDGN